MDPNTKAQLAALINDTTLGNKTCVDCGAANPQWCSLSFAIFICLSCAGIHRGFGVHISFVRSVSMDSFSDEQLRKMKLGGNNPFKEFMSSYQPADVGGYVEGMTLQEKYQCWAASQYRDKLNAAMEGKSWSPSLPTTKSSDDVAQGLRKSRAGSGRANTSYSDFSREGSPVPAANRDTLGAPANQKAANESYFASLGSANASRSADLPPSQGGRYSGFGNTPTPPSSHPSFGLSSAAAPSLEDLQNDPVAALGKGWSLFSSVVAGATRAVNSSVIQPGLEKATDPNFRTGVLNYVSESGKNVSEWSKSQLGVDVGGIVGSVASNVASTGRDAYSSIAGNGGRGGGYSRAQQYGGLENEEEGSALYADGGDDDFFHEFNQNHAATSTNSSSTPIFGGKQSSSAATTGAPPPPPKPKKDDWNDDEWKDF